MFQSIRWRLTLSYVLITLLVVSVVGVLTLSLLTRTIERQEQELLTLNAEAVARQAWSLMWPVVSQRELQELARTASFLGNARVQILDGNYRVLADAQPSVEGDEFVWILPPWEWRAQMMGESSWPFILAIHSEKQPCVSLSADGSFTILEQLPSDTAFTRVRRWDGMWGSRFVFYTVSEANSVSGEHLERPFSPRSEQTIVVTIGQEHSPRGFVEIGSGPDFGAEALRTTRQALVFAAGGAVLVALVVGLIVSRGLSAPLRELTAAAGEMSSGNLSVRAPLRGRGEIGQLARQFNHMAERLEANFAALSAERDALRRFIADASHELRTPITALKNFNELLQGFAADDADARTEFLAESQAQIERLEWITRNLLNLSRLDAGLVALDLADHDVEELIQDAASPFKTLAREKGLIVAAQPLAAPWTVWCDRERIVLALSNLLDNAYKFTPRGGRVEIGAEQADGLSRLWVKDTGPGIDPSELEHIFERFYRGHAGRSKDSGAQEGDWAALGNERGQDSHSGLGLGLAIVRSVVQAHGGRVHVESQVGAGSLFTIELPPRS